jgi:hypothetical protein
MKAGRPCRGWPGFFIISRIKARLTLLPYKRFAGTRESAGIVPGLMRPIHSHLTPRESVQLQAFLSCRHGLDSSAARRAALRFRYSGDHGTKFRHEPSFVSSVRPATRATPKSFPPPCELPDEVDRISTSRGGKIQ